MAVIKETVWGGNEGDVRKINECKKVRLPEMKMMMMVVMANTKKKTKKEKKEKDDESADKDNDKN